MRTQFTVLQVLQEQLQQQRSVAGQAEAASRGGKVFRGLLVCVCRQNKSLLRPMLVDAFDLSGKRHCCIGDALYMWSAFSHRFLNYTMRCCAGAYASLVAQLHKEIALSQQLRRLTPARMILNWTCAPSLQPVLLVALLKSDQPAVQEPAADALGGLTCCSQHHI